LTFEDNGEVTFDSDFLIISETDEKGNIIYANNNFIEISGFKKEEIIGYPHNIVRHPDMPRVAFKMVWDDLKKKGFWEGFVKNLRKDGKFYWVYSTIMRKVDSSNRVTYMSIRTKPKKSDVEKAEKLYATLK
jgi:aerotaxis receptor